MLKSETNIKKHNYVNKITNTKIIIESDNDSCSNNDEELDSDEESITNIQNDKLVQYESELISKYIIQDKIIDFNSKSILCYYLWSGIEYLGKWEYNK